MSKERSFRFNVLVLRPARRLLMQPWFPVVFQGCTFAIMIGLIINGWGLGMERTSEELLTLRKTNLTTLAVWGLWWPGMIALVLFLGRVWCTVCPMEAVNRLADTLARRLGWPRARLGRRLRTGWMALTLYFFLQALVAGLSIHRVPHYTAWMLLALFVLASLSGIFFSDARSFCVGFCPASPLLSVYGRYTPIQLDTCDPAICGNCSTKDCVQHKNRHRFDRRSCPSLLRPFNRQQSDGCVLCLQCAKICTYENIGFGLTSHDSSVRRPRLLQPVEATFVMIAAGFVAHEVVGKVNWLDHYFHVVPEALSGIVPTVPIGWWEGLWFLVLFPALLWLIVAGIGWLAGHRESLMNLFLAAATGAAPVVALSHLAKVSAKLSSWGGYLTLALKDPRGLQTYDRIVSGGLDAPGWFVGLSLTGWMMVIVMAVLAFISVRRLRTFSARQVPAALAGLSVMAVIFGGVFVVWAFT